MAELIVYLRKEHGFIEAGGILKGGKFHGLPILCMHRLPGHRPTNGGYPFSHMGMDVPGPDKIQPLHDTCVSVKGVGGKEKAQGIQLMSQRETFWVRSLFKGERLVGMENRLGVFSC